MQSGQSAGAFKFLLLAGGMLYAAPGFAQTTPAKDVTEASETSDSEIIVTGTRRSLEDALQTKRASVEVLDSISSEGIGKLPDLSLAESLQRLPGVQINRSAQRRAGTVSIRGLPGDFSQTLINGQYLASPDVSNFAFGNVRSEVFSGVDVLKASNAKSLTGGLSGLVNLKTGSPLSSPEQMTLTFDGRYEELQQKMSPGAAFILSKQLIPGVLGIRASVGYRRMNYREDNLQINTYDRVAGAATTDFADDVYAPRQIRLPTQVTKGDAYSASGAIEWAPTSTLTATLHGFYNDYRPNFYQSQFLIESMPASTRIASETIDEGALGKSQNHILITNAQLITDSRYEDARARTGAYTADVSWKSGGWTVSGTAHYTKASRYNNINGYQAQQRVATAGTNGITVDFNSGGGILGNARYDLVTGSARPDLSQPFGPLITPSYREVRGLTTPLLSFIGGFRNTTEHEDELSFRFDVQRELNFGPISSVEAGGIYRDKGQDQRNPIQTMFGVDFTKLNNNLYNYSFLDGTGRYLDGKIGYFDRGDYAEFDVVRMLSLLPPASVSNLPPNSAIGAFGFVELTDSTAIAITYDNKQKIYGGYGQVNLDQQMGDDFHLRGNLGMRYEKSERSTLSRNAANQPVQIDFAFDNWLPSANLSLEAWSNFVLRGSYTRTMRRPQVDSFAVVRSVAIDAVGSIITVNLGAGDLKPFTSDNIDLALEWYNRAGSTLAVTLFQKNVKDYAAATRICPTDGGGLGYGPLTNASGVCRTTQATPASGTFPAVQSGATVLLNVTANQDSFTLKGFELSAQQNLSFLPAPWNGFGGQVNYTYVDFKSSSAFRLSEISKDTVNAILYYENKDFGIRAAYNYRSAYFLGSGGTGSGADRFVKARGQLDLSAQLNITDQLTANAEIFNVTNEILYEYEGAETRARNYTVYGRTASLGFAYRF